jgi:MFS family permease
VAFVLLEGAGYGVISIMRPVITAELLGRHNFGVISGLIAIPFVGAVAASPTVAAVLWQAAGYDSVILLAAGAALLGLLSLLSAAMIHRRRH